MPEKKANPIRTGRRVKSRPMPRHDPRLHKFAIAFTPTELALLDEAMDRLKLPSRSATLYAALDLIAQIRDPATLHRLAAERRARLSRITQPVIYTDTPG